MRRLMSGRSIGAIRAEMAQRGIKIGGGTLHRAVKGEVGNRLESLEKIAEFFDTTVDQLLQFDGVDDTYWPFSTDLQQKVLLLSDEELRKAENVLRAHLGLEQISASDFTNTSQLPYGTSAIATYPRAMEEGAELLDQADVPAPKKHGRKTVRGPSHQKGGGGT